MPNASQPIALESSLQVAVQPADNPFGRLKLTVKQVRELEDIDDFAQEQDDAEVSMLIAQMSMRVHRRGRLSAYG